jgi:hypothetical protein
MKQQALMAALALGATAGPVHGRAQLAMPRPTIVLVHDRKGYRSQPLRTDSRTQPVC